MVGQILVPSVCAAIRDAGPAPLRRHGGRDDDESVPSALEGWQGEAQRESWR